MSKIALALAITLLSAPAAFAAGPDESGLRYFASRGERARIEAEIKRLQRLYPDWRVPEHLDDVAQEGADESDLWKLYADDKLDELARAIEARKATDPNWKLSSDLSRKFHAKQFRQRVAAFMNDGQWRELVAFAEQNDNLDGAEIDLLWTLAEAYCKVKQNAKAVEIYRAVLESNNDGAVRLATLQKALANLRVGEVEKLVAGRPERAALEIPLTRARIAAFLHEEEAQDVSAAAFANFQREAQSASGAKDAELVGWYYRKKGAQKDALDWFKLAMERDGDAMSAHGLALTLLDLGYRREAEDVAYAWREPLVNNMILYIDIVERGLTDPSPALVEPRRLERFGAATQETASAEGAQALGWYAYNNCNFVPALEWFKRAMAWAPRETTAQGYALTLKRLHRDKDYLEVVNRYDGLFPRLVEMVFNRDAGPNGPVCETAAIPRNAGARAAVPLPRSAMGVPGAMETFGLPDRRRAAERFAFRRRRFGRVRRIRRLCARAGAWTVAAGGASCAGCWRNAV